MIPEDVVKSLQSTDLDERRKAARFIKNAIIGAKLKKKLYANLGVITRYESLELFSPSFSSPNNNNITVWWRYSRLKKMIIPLYNL